MLIVLGLDVPSTRASSTAVGWVATAALANAATDLRTNAPTRIRRTVTPSTRGALSITTSIQSRHWPADQRPFGIERIGLATTSEATARVPAAFVHTVRRAGQ